MKTIQTFSLFLFAFLASNVVFAERSEDYPREIQKTFSVNKDVRFKCDLDFSDVVITTWDQPTIEIVLIININAKSEERANEMFEKIKVDMNGNASLVNLAVNVENLNCKNNENWSMDATVKMPASGSVEADVDFGDFTINDLSGLCDLYLQYGDFVAGKLSNKNNVAHVAFGNAKIDSWGGGEFGVQYGDAKIADVNGNIDLNVQFGDASINNLSSSCKQLNGHVEYGDLKIKLGTGFGGSFEAIASYGDVELPMHAKITSKEKDFSGSNKAGTIGSGSSVLKVNASFGDVEIE
jgi:hypothetical protein